MLWTPHSSIWSSSLLCLLHSFNGKFKLLFPQFWSDMKWQIDMKLIWNWYNIQAKRWLICRPIDILGLSECSNNAAGAQGADQEALPEPCELQHPKKAEAHGVQDAKPLQPFFKKTQNKLWKKKHKTKTHQKFKNSSKIHTTRHNETNSRSAHWEGELEMPVTQLDLDEKVSFQQKKTPFSGLRFISLDSLAASIGTSNQMYAFKVTWSASPSNCRRRMEAASAKPLVGLNQSQQLAKCMTKKSTMVKRRHGSTKMRCLTSCSLNKTALDFIPGTEETNVQDH